MTPRERVESALRRENDAFVPFTIYENKFPQCRAERDLRNRGLCIVRRDLPCYRVIRPNVKETRKTYVEDGRSFVRTYIETPCGTLTGLKEKAGFTHWTHEYLFKSPDDYKALRFYFEDERYEPAYDAFLSAQEADGGDSIFRAALGLEPLQTLISGNLMDMQEFCIQWMDNRDALLDLYGVIVENRRSLYPIVAASPALHANYGGNVVPEIVSPEMHREYYLPHYWEAAEALHKAGKLLGSHYDAECAPFKESLSQTPLDYIEAFTPAPDTSMTLQDARRAWPDKVIWLNFPSSVHLQEDDYIENFTLEMLRPLAQPNGIIMGITEDIPEHRWRRSCTAIMNGLDRYAGEYA